MYTNILIPTDGSELAGKAVQHGIALAKRIGAKVTVLTVLPPFHTITTDTQMIEDTPAQYKARMQKHAEKILGAVVTQAAGVACETIQVEHEHPYQAIIDTADAKGCDKGSAHIEIKELLVAQGFKECRRGFGLFADILRELASTVVRIPKDDIMHRDQLTRSGR
jgi:Universal stress protein family